VGPQIAANRALEIAFHTDKTISSRYLTVYRPISSISLELALGY
jgi:hypothetical protein